MLSIFSNWDHCQRFSPLQIFDTTWTGCEPVQNRSSGFVEWNYAAVQQLHHNIAATQPLMLISKFLTSQLGKQTITIHILPNILRSKDNQTMILG